MARPRKPTVLKVLEGNRGRRPLQSEPEPAKGQPDIPTGLSEVAARVWGSLSEELDRLGLLTVIDGCALEAACRAYAGAVEADEIIAGLQGRIRNGKRTDQKSFYRLSIMNAVSKKNWQQFKSFCTEFGLTPASRSKLAVGATGHQIDSLEARLCG